MTRRQRDTFHSSSDKEEVGARRFLGPAPLMHPRSSDTAGSPQHVRMFDLAQRAGGVPGDWEQALTCANTKENKKRQTGGLK